MTAGTVLSLTFDFALVIAVILMFVYEKKLIVFEDAVCRAVKAYSKARRAEKEAEAERARRSIQSRAPAAEQEDEIVVAVVRGGKRVSRSRVA